MIAGILGQELLGVPVKWYEAGRAEYDLPVIAQIPILFLVMGFLETKRFVGFKETGTVSSSSCRSLRGWLAAAGAGGQGLESSGLPAASESAAPGNQDAAKVSGGVELGGSKRHSSLGCSQQYRALGHTLQQAECEKKLLGMEVLPTDAVLLPGQEQKPARTYVGFSWGRCCWARGLGMRLGRDS